MELTWVFAALSAVILGMAKAGLKGVGTIIVTLMALAYEAKASTGIMLPLLILADVMAVLYYRRSADWSLLVRFMPWMVLGVLIGAYAGHYMNAEAFKHVMAVIILFSVLIMILLEWLGRNHVPQNRWFAASMGSAAGFTTMVGNLAGAFSDIYFLALRTPKQTFIGTAAWIYFLINLFKLPFHVWVWGTVDWTSMQQSIRWVPFVLLGFSLGIFIVSKLQEQTFRYFILVMTTIGAVVLLMR